MYMLAKRIRAMRHATHTTTYRHLFRWFEHRLVAHVERAHQMQDRNFKRKVERSYESNGAIRPPMPNRGMPVEVTGDTKGLRQSTYIVSSKIVQK